MLLQRFNKVFSIGISLSLFCSQSLMAADLRKRNVIEPINNRVVKSSNDTDVINIANPNKKGISHNKYNKFDIYDGVILNNSLKKGASAIGGVVEQNHNLKSEANLIITEVISSNPTSLNGAVEVFGKRADLVFANENGFNINGVNFINTNGITVSTGLYNDGLIMQKSNGKIDILEKGIITDGNYFNIIADTINLTGNILHTNYGKENININLISGKNTIDLNTKENPQMVSSQISDTAGFSIDGSNLNSMYANKIKIISTNEGLGVRHQGLIASLEDIEIKAKSDIQTNLISSKNTSIDAKNIFSTIIDSDNINLNAKKQVVNSGLMNANSIQINSKNIINSYDSSSDLKEVGINNSIINAKNLSIEAGNLFLNNGIVQSTNNIVLAAEQIENNLVINAGNNINLNFNNDLNLNNNGIILSNKDINLNANSVIINDSFGQIYATNRLYLQSANDLSINSRLENIGDISLIATNNIAINDIVASSNQLSAQSKNLTNNAYVLGQNIDLHTQDSIINNSIFDSLTNLNLSSHTITNNGSIFANNNINIEANILNNTAKVSQNLIKSNSAQIDGYGWVGYGDTAFKTWDGTITIYPYYYQNNILADMASIKGNTININTQSKNNDSQINNDGIIYGNSNVSSYGNIKNTIYTTAINVTDILSNMKVSEINTKEWLGSWNTNASKYFANGSNLLEILKYFADANIKNHQKESVWKAIKDASNKDANLKTYLSLLLGSDYLNTTFLPHSSTWNKNAKITYSANSGAKIGSDGSMYLIGNSIINGNKESIDIEKINNITDQIYKYDITKIIKSNANKSDNIHNLLNKTMENSIFKVSNTDKYYITTDLDFINQDNLYGSSYLLSQLEISSNIQVIGDEYYEQKLLNNMSNEASIGFLSNEDIKILLDNALEQQNILGLELGKDLTLDQIENIQKDMIWYVKVDLDGKEILVPKIYLKNETNDSKSYIVAGTNLYMEADQVTNNNSSIVAGNSLIINSNIDNINSNIIANQILLNGNNINLYGLSSIDNNGNMVLKNATQISAKNYLAINAADSLNIYASQLNSNGVINLDANNINILNGLNTNSTYNFSKQNEAFITTSTTTNDVLATNIKANEIHIASNEMLNITGSNIDGSNLVSLQSKNININDAISSSSININSVFSGINDSTKMLELQTITNNSIKQSLSNGSQISSNGDVLISALDNVNVKGSTIESDHNTIIDANNIHLLNGSNEFNSNTQQSSIQALGFSNQLQNISAQTSTASIIEANENINLLANNELKLIGSSINTKGELNMSGNDILIQASKNTINQTTTKNALGIVANFSSGLAEYGQSVNWLSIDNQANTNLVHQDSHNESVNGLILDDAIAKVDIGIEFTHTGESINQISHTMSVLNANNINMKANNSIDLGGGNFNALDSINILANKIDTTKYEDTQSISDSGYSLALKQTFDTTSNIASLTNQIANNINVSDENLELNYGILAAQSIANTINFVTGDLISQNSYQSLGFKYDEYNANSSKENITNITANNIILETLNGDLNLNGVKFDANNISLNSAQDININAAKESFNATSFGLSAEIQTTQTVGTGMLDGANTQVGVGGSIGGYYSTSDTTKYINSTINAKDNLNLSSNGNTTILGANINAKDIILDINQDLTVKSLADTSLSNGFNANISSDVSLGLSSNTIFTGDASLYLGFGYHNSNSNLVTNQSHILASNSLNGNIGNNLDLTGTILGSSNSIGNLKVNGQINLNNLNINNTSDGAYVGISGGTEGNIGTDININNHIAQNGLLLSAINILVNDNQVSNSDITNTLQINDSSWAGGNINASAQLDSISNAINKIKNNTDSYDITQIAQSNIIKNDTDIKNISEFNGLIADYIEIPVNYAEKGYSPELQALIQTFQYDYNGELSELKTSLEYIQKYGNQITHDEVLQTIGSTYFSSAHKSEYSKIMNNLYSNIAEDVLTKEQLFQHLDEYEAANGTDDLIKIAKLLDQSFIKVMKEDLNIDANPTIFKVSNGDKTFYRSSEDSIHISPVILSNNGQFSTSSVAAMLFHELTHKVQNYVEQNRNNDKLNIDSIKEYLDVLQYNQYMYTTPASQNNMLYLYKNQPVEQEAYQNQDAFEGILSVIFDKDIEEDTKIKFLRKVLKNGKNVFMDALVVAGGGSSNQYNDNDSDSDSDSDTDSDSDSDSDSDD